MEHLFKVIGQRFARWHDATSQFVFVSSRVSTVFFKFNIIKPDEEVGADPPKSFTVPPLSNIKKRRSKRFGLMLSWVVGGVKPARCDPLPPPTPPTSERNLLDDKMYEVPRLPRQA